MNKDKELERSGEGSTSNARTIDLTIPLMSDRIREMVDLKVPVSVIARELKIRYNFAYNVTSIYIMKKFSITVKEYYSQSKEEDQ